MKEDCLAVVDLIDEQFDRGWGAGVQAAFEIVESELGGLGHTRIMTRIRNRFLEELEVTLEDE